MPDMSEAAFGFRAHSGWTALVVVGGPWSRPTVLRRQRVELAADYEGALQPFHAAEGLKIEKAASLIRRSTEAAHALARRALRQTVAELEKDGHEPVAAGLLLASGRPLPDLPRILASHALIHSADGELFRDALRDESRACGLGVTMVKERGVFDHAAKVLGVPAPELKRRIAGMRQELGPPWRADEKLATLAAWIALAQRPER
jgi:hypothetical protein